MRNFTSKRAPKHLKKGGFTDSLFWTFLWLFLAGIGIGVLSLLFAVGPYGFSVFKSYFHHLLILFLNIAPVLLLIFCLYFLYGSARAAYITTSSVVVGLTFVNYYLLKFRDDPLMFADLLNAREGFSITVKQKYNLAPDRRMWFGIVCVLLGVFFISLFVRHRSAVRFRKRMVLALIPAVLMVPLFRTISNQEVYKQKAVNFDSTNQWSATQVYLSKGFVYPFLHSMTFRTLKKPSGYRTSDAEKILDKYQDAKIPDSRKVSVITIQLEAFSDLSETGAKGVDWDQVYGTYHKILENCYHGRLITNIFAGGTVNTERCYLTGFTQLKDFRENTNSYVRYFKSQGYSVTGSHPSYEWFYNRKNINQYLGFSNYYFYENYYKKLANNKIAADNLLMPEIYRLYQKEHQDGKPVFSFNVTYQGHGPYDSSNVWRGEHFTDGRYSTASTNILDNYLGSIKDTAEQIQKLLESLQSSGDPVLVILYGDHKPWLGNDNSVYRELGINLNLSTEEGFLNKYTTDYVIWASDAAVSILGDHFKGQGPNVSSNYLMNQLFDLCSWKGNAWMQATEDVHQVLPVMTTVGRFSEGGDLVEEKDLSKKAAATLKKYNLIQYYWEKHFSD